ncbi:MAG: carbohydrate ABC transporter permease [Acidobacteria bacterium]|nr:carbohydrate ABC transporter permease [Acidobacteriota bacterium]MBI3424057.1 carbohydrate ABC transporter permease [Acidobacteriota bacterium]
MTKESKAQNWIQYALAIGVALLFALPLLAMLTTSLRDPAKAAAGFALLPDSLHWQNYVAAWRATNFPRQFVNSLVMALGVTAGQIITSLLAGYAFARMEFFGKRALFMTVLATLIIPFQILVIPVFIILVKLAWINTYWALIVPSLANAFGIFLFTQFFKTIPYELEEAAYLDGASRWTVLWRIMVPLSRSAITTLFLFTFIAEWNDLFKPLVFTSTKSMRTVQLGLTVFQEQFKVDYALLMAAVVFVTLPSVLLFFLGQKQFIKGIATTGFK